VLGGLTVLGGLSLLIYGRVKARQTLHPVSWRANAHGGCAIVPGCSLSALFGRVRR
jgi:hypothetical protein